MKKRIIFWFIIFVISGIIPNLAQQSTGVYEYPIKPGSDEWKAFTTHGDMINSCQIPSSILQSMSTIDLIETCLTYPLFGDMFLHDHFQKGFDAVSAHFNGLQELLKRKDAGNFLLEKYKGMDPNALDQTWSSLQKGEYAANFYFVEILLAQEVILKKLQKIQKESLLNECIRKAQEKQKYPEVFGMLSFENIGLIAGRIMLIENFEPLIQKIETDEHIKWFLQNGPIPSQSLIDELLTLADQYLNKK